MMRRPLLLSAIFAITVVTLGACKSTPEERAERAAQCPEGRAYDEMFCARVPRYARHPETGKCCRYESACAAPVGWKSYTSREACEKAGPKEEEQPEAQPDAGQPSPDAGASSSCPAPKQSQGMCAQVITWAKNPQTGECCQYPTPCAAPDGWATFSSEGACSQASSKPAQGQPNGGDASP